MTVAKVDRWLTAVCSFVPELLLLLALTACAPPSCAGESDGEDLASISFRGFGTIGALHSNEHLADFKNSLFQPGGAGYSHDWSAAVDSRIGGQVTANVNDQLSAVLQVVSEQQWDATYHPTIEWANVKYAWSPDASIRFGRIALPSFLYSESRKVGYTYPWIRPPVEIYRLLPISNSDGADVSYRFHIDGLINTVTALNGRNDIRDTSGQRLTVRDMSVLADTIEYGALMIHSAYQAASLTIPSIAAIPNPALSRLGINSPYRFLEVGASYEPGNWFLLGECVRISIPFNGRELGWYASTGVRKGNFTPFISYARQRQQTPSGLLQPTPQATASVGVRWDFMRKADLKVQVDHVKLDRNSAGVFDNIQAGFQRGGNVNLIGFSIDFIY